MKALDLSSLMRKASKARPTGRQANARWTELLPLYQQLRANRLTGKEAVGWLIEQGAVQESDRARASEALQKLELRRRRASQQTA